MGLLFTIVVLVFVVAVVVLVGLGVFEMSPFAHHQDRYRDPGTGKPTARPPNLLH